MKNSDQPAVGHAAINKISEIHYSGLTKREYFAAMAMQGLLACPLYSPKNNASMITSLTTESIQYADAILSELEKCDTKQS